MSFATSDYKNQMAKYDPLHKFLRRQRTSTVSLTFAEIERILGVMLPKAATNPDWWAETSTSNGSGVQRLAWKEAGFSAVLIDHHERVIFRVIESAADDADLTS